MDYMCCIASHWSNHWLICPMVYVPQRKRIFSVFHSKSSKLKSKRTTSFLFLKRPSLSIPYIIKSNNLPNWFTESLKKSLMANQFEKCPNKYVPLYLSIKCLKHMSEMICLIFLNKQSKRWNNIVKTKLISWYYDRN